MGHYLLAEMGIHLSQLDHRNFARAQAIIDEKGEVFFERSVETIEAALHGLYGGQQVSLQRLAATFRRGELLEFLPPP